MLQVIKLFFFVWITLYINTMLSMQQPNPKAEVAALVKSFEDLNLEDGDFSPLPLEIRQAIFNFIKYGYPWDEIIKIVNIRTVCKRWLSILKDMDAILKQRNIPPLHFAAMANDTEKIMTLKMSNTSSLREPDCHGLRAAHYALATKKHHAIRMLKIGHALDTLKQNSQKLEPFIVDNDPESLNILRADYDKEYTIEELIDAVKSANIIRLEEILSKIANPIVIIKQPFTTYESLVADPKPFVDRLRFAFASALEDEMFDCMYNCENISSNIFGLFKSVRANINAYDELGRTILIQACMPELLPTLIELLKDENVDINLPSKDTDAVTCLHVAVLNNNIEAAQKLLEIKDAHGKCRLNVNAQNGLGHTPLQIAASGSNFDLIDLLLKHGADINAQNNKEGFSPIHFAAQNGDTKIFEAFFNNQTCNIEALDADGNTPLITATIWDQSDCVKLLRKRANTSCKDKYGNSLLHIAAREGSIASMKEIFPDLFPVINSSNNRGFAPLHMTIIKGHNECAQFLIDKRAIVDIRNKVGETPLHYAASLGNLQAIEMLVKNSASINAKNNNDVIFNNKHMGEYTPLHFAVNGGHLEAVKACVRLGADIHAKTTRGKKPLDLAYELEHQEIAAYLAELK